MLNLATWKPSRLEMVAHFTLFFLIQGFNVPPKNKQA